jgi:hypothetical protein
MFFAEELRWFTFLRDEYAQCLGPTGPILGPPGPSTHPHYILRNFFHREYSSKRENFALEDGKTPFFTEFCPEANSFFELFASLYYVSSMT